MTSQGVRPDCRHPNKVRSDRDAQTWSVRPTCPSPWQRLWPRCLPRNRPAPYRVSVPVAANCSSVEREARCCRTLRQASPGKADTLTSSRHTRSETRAETVSWAGSESSRQRFASPHLPEIRLSRRARLARSTRHAPTRFHVPGDWCRCRVFQTGRRDSAQATLLESIAGLRQSRR